MYIIEIYYYALMVVFLDGYSQENKNRTIKNGT